MMHTNSRVIAHGKPVKSRRSCSSHSGTGIGNWIIPWASSRTIAVTQVEALTKAFPSTLRFEAYDKREEAVAQTFDTTYEWVFSRDAKQKDGKPMRSRLPQWLEGQAGRPYWITGEPGSGKSAIMKFIHNHPALRKPSLSLSLSLSRTIASHSYQVLRVELRVQHAEVVGRLDDDSVDADPGRKAIIAANTLSGIKQGG
ncbi:hypothetical protein B0H67DRAFT_155611 [Lasiosphaeris hirsuta]|uniref:Uncharacterized protein n=1 Tax=Lasiosphaeris hirsuta TaxID=260670 RepID=A0AA40DXT3_9PEZI|nr:hypothetical protein B0H67DRAFT_155611 [Lasiosphaeris hirsuta]